VYGMLRVERSNKSTRASVPPVGHSVDDLHKSVFVNEPNKYTREWGGIIKFGGRVRRRKNAPVARKKIQLVPPLVVKAETAQCSGLEFSNIINCLVYK
jgi:hypothetical protein